MRGNNVMKMITRLSTFFASLGMIFSLASCGSNGNDSDYKKVKKAFNGVETSLKTNKTQSNKRVFLPKQAINEGSSDSLAAIEALFNSIAESRGDTIDELEYDQPPMIQFQCLKAVFDSTGEGFTFSNKYYDTINGDVYFDINTGEEKDAQSGDEYHYTYDFVLSLGIKFEDSLITADISFDITLNQGNNHFNVYWFVKMYLEYDFNHSNPTYTLLMVTDNEQTDLPFRLGCTYEYDYVKVNESKITEWRKFYYEVDQKLVRDSTHPNFDSYKDSVNYSSGNISWYKNHDYKKINDHSSENDLAIAKELFTLGLNSTDIPKEEYFKQGGSQNAKIKEMYQSFSNVFRKDIIYSLVTGGQPEEGGGEQVDAASLRFYFNGSENVFDNCQCSTSDHDITVGDLFIPNGHAWNGDTYPTINYMDEHGGRIGIESDLNKLKAFITYNGSTEEAGFDKEISGLLFKGASADYRVYGFDLTIKVRNNENVQGSMHVLYDFAEPQTEEDDTIYSLALANDNSVTTDGWWSIVDDIRVIDIFEPNKTHREYNENTGGIDTVSNYRFVYQNKKGQILSQVSLSDITFGIKDFDSEGSDYMMSETIGTSKISDLWFTANTKYDADGVSFVAMSNNTELEKEQRQATFTVVVKRGLDGAIPLEMATRNIWPAKPIENAGLSDDFPRIDPSQNLSDDIADGKYYFYFAYGLGFDDAGDRTIDYVEMYVRLTSEERDAYVASFTRDYGYVSNGLYYDDNLEFVKNERRLVFGQDVYNKGTDLYQVWVYKIPGKLVSDVHFDSMQLEYHEEGYVVGGDIIRVHPLDDAQMEAENIYVTYLFDGYSINGETIRDPGTYEITAEIRYPNASMFMERIIVATITILPE